jgi:hypothetical protein
MQAITGCCFFARSESISIEQLQTTTRSMMSSLVATMHNYEHAPIHVDSARSWKARRTSVQASAPQQRRKGGFNNNSVLINHIILDRRHNHSTKTTLRQSPAARDARNFEFALMRTIIAAAIIAASAATSTSATPLAATPLAATPLAATPLAATPTTAATLFLVRSERKKHGFAKNVRIVLT